MELGKEKASPSLYPTVEPGCRVTKFRDIGEFTFTIRENPDILSLC